jgi:hypothetical protein
MGCAQREVGVASSEHRHPRARSLAAFNRAAPPSVAIARAVARGGIRGPEWAGCSAPKVTLLRDVLRLPNDPEANVASAVTAWGEPGRSAAKTRRERSAMPASHGPGHRAEVRLRGVTRFNGGCDFEIHPWPSDGSHSLIVAVGASYDADHSSAHARTLTAPSSEPGPSTGPRSAASFGLCVRR